MYVPLIRRKYHGPEWSKKKRKSYTRFTFYYWSQIWATKHSWRLATFKKIKNIKFMYVFYEWLIATSYLTLKEKKAIAQITWRGGQSQELKIWKWEKRRVLFWLSFFAAPLIAHWFDVRQRAASVGCVGFMRCINSDAFPKQEMRLVFWSFWVFGVAIFGFDLIFYDLNFALFQNVT